jgi:D-glucosaminate-6-phosphate ammonia-lyase
MQRKTQFLAAGLIGGLLMVMSGNLIAADAPADVAGSWDVTIESERGSFNQTLTLTQDGSAIKGTLKNQRGESTLEGSVTGNAIKFTSKRQTDNGTFSMDYTGTVDSDSMSGTLHNERFDAKWSAKRSKAASGN